MRLRPAALTVTCLLACGVHRTLVPEPSSLAPLLEMAPDPRALAVPDSLRAALAADPDSVLPLLVRRLTLGIDDESTRARIIHDWVAGNLGYDADAYFRDDTCPGDVAGVLRSGRSACAGFANVYERMCRFAGLECVTIPGYARGYGFQSFGDEDPGAKNHAWNAVRVEGRWRLLDPTWGAGHIAGRSFVQRYDGDYFFADPAAFIYTHFPADPTWQLLPAPVSDSAFRELPYLRGRFFGFGLKLITRLARQTAVGSRSVVEIAVPDGISLLARMVSSDSVPRPVPVRSACGRVRLDLTFPAPGHWRVDVYARRDRSGGVYDGVASFAFVSSLSDAPGGH